MGEEKPQAVRMHGEIVDNLPNATFRVRLENGQMVIGHIATELRMHYTGMRPGDRVTVEVTAYDVSRARIVSRAR